MKKLLLLFILLSTLFSNAQTIALQSFATGFSNAVGIVHPPNDSRLFVLQRFGLIRILNSNGTITATPFLDVSTLVSTSPGNERGLLGLAFHPNYATNGIFFINYTDTLGDTVIAKYTVSANPDVANTTATILMTIDQPFSNHNGGCINFGPDGYLYIGMGDGGSSGDPNGYAQNLTVDAANPSRINLGKMLRIDVDTTVGALNYGFPPTNPFINEPGKEAIWAYGLRNPWKFSFNRLNGDLWIGDVGQGAVEEVDKITAPLPTGLNFGWRCYEGNSTYNTSGCAPMSSMVFPVAQYDHSTGCAITGGYLYTGSMYPNFANNYFYTDYCDNKIRTLNAANVVSTTASFTGNFTAFGEDANGELYVAGITNGIIYKIIDSSLGLNDFNKNGLSFYPNPAKTEIFIKNSAETVLSKAKIFDLTGKLVLTKTIENNDSNPSVNITALSSGFYMIAVEDVSGNQYQSKLVVE
ncbi:PQQ-dependent sugar dehydrogenase [Flavobacterium paronense]|uniref:PQQ-dependent sugar dehydrogenase n=1 Tax=Flavobacterium paronense TaxID=1392775 RepID=A0ABV5GEA3_9FLAO|nr:PQQ-dependent sugar dehydrogenase [Flavobacterium paronense]MDN3678283.1 PQQ-dependent sugar dehydrogenase [Flavobacterium paronense]